MPNETARGAAPNTAWDGSTLAKTCQLFRKLYDWYTPIKPLKAMAMGQTPFIALKVCSGASELSRARDSCMRRRRKWRCSSAASLGKPSRWPQW